MYIFPEWVSCGKLLVVYKNNYNNLATSHGHNV